MTRGREAHQPLGIGHGEVSRPDIVLADHHGAAESLPDLLGAQVDAVTGVQAGQLRMGRAQRVLHQLQHRGPDRSRLGEVHGRDVDAGDGNVVMQHRLDHRDRVAAQSRRLGRESQPDAELAMRRARRLLQGGDRRRAALLRLEIVQGRALDVDVDRVELIGVDHRVVGRGEALHAGAGDIKAGVGLAAKRHDGLRSVLLHLGDARREREQLVGLGQRVGGSPARRAARGGVRDHKPQDRLPGPVG